MAATFAPIDLTLRSLDEPNSFLARASMLGGFRINAFGGASAAPGSSGNAPSPLENRSFGRGRDLSSAPREVNATARTALEIQEAPRTVAARIRRWRPRSAGRRRGRARP